VCLPIPKANTNLGIDYGYGVNFNRSDDIINFIFTSMGLNQTMGDIAYREIFSPGSSKDAQAFFKSL